MATVSKVIITNVLVSAPVISPAQNLPSGGGQTWTATLDSTLNVPMSIDFTIQSAPASSGPWTDISNNHIELPVDGLDKHGNPNSHHVETFGLYGAGPWWRLDVTAISGSLLVNTLTVTNS